MKGFNPTDEWGELPEEWQAVIIDLASRMIGQKFWRANATRSMEYASRAQSKIAPESASQIFFSKFNEKMAQLAPEIEGMTDVEFRRQCEAMVAESVGRVVEAKSDKPPAGPVDASLN